MAEQIVSLRIQLDPYPQDRRTVNFTLVDGAGNTLPATIGMQAARLEDNVATLARIAAGTTEATGGIPFGEFDDTRVNFQFDGAGQAPYGFSITIAYPGGDGAYQAVTAVAGVSQASLDRLAGGFTQLLTAGAGTYDWVVADQESAR